MRNKTVELINYIQARPLENLSNTKVNKLKSIMLTKYVKKAFGMSKTIINKRSVWGFNGDSEVLKGELSASRVAQILISYKKAIRSLGAIHPNYKESLINARDLLKKYGAEPEEYNGLKPTLKIETITDRLVIISKKYNDNPALSNAALIKGLVNSIDIYHPFYYALAAPISCTKAISNSKNQTALKEKHDEKRKVNAKKLYTKALEVLKTPSDFEWVDMVLALCSLTGRRPTEIMKTASFSLCKTNKKYLTFSGVLKARDRRLDDDFGFFDIPVLCDPKIIIKSLQLMRSRLGKEEKRKASGGGSGYWTGGLLEFVSDKGIKVKTSIFDKKYTKDLSHNEAVANQYNGMLNTKLRKWVDFDFFSVHDLRAIYTKAVFEKEKESSAETYESMTTRILCYSKKSIAKAVNHYAAIEIDNSIDGFVVRLESKDKAQVKENNNLLEKLAKYDLSIEEKAVKAKKLTAIHAWARKQCEKGVKENDLTIGYIRKFCKVNGKSLNYEVVALYLVLCFLVDELETPKMSYVKNPDGLWLVTSKTTNLQRLL